MGIVPVKLLEYSDLFFLKYIYIDMCSVKVKYKYTYIYGREVNEPSWVGIVPVKPLLYSNLFKNKKKRLNWDVCNVKINIHTIE